MRKDNGKRKNNRIQSKGGDEYNSLQAAFESEERKQGFIMQVKHMN